MNIDQTIEWNLRVLRLLVQREAERLDTEKRRSSLTVDDVIGIVKKRNEYVVEELTRICARLKDVALIPEALIDDVLREEVA